ncbi:hypothetical protein SKAU_G00398220 [Synaphobranchus kaupii]|uniref:Uncharacterized protein n=1 Tax=Synaphobranchus kaupii TaxID=118154 RepID=A0A9Q1IA48_SYNKA|nr:hypothetical protein SKAU_G00398220 [Synaphobranchus kaupii]
MSSRQPIKLLGGRANLPAHFLSSLETGAPSLRVHRVCSEVIPCVGALYQLRGFRFCIVPSITEKSEASIFIESPAEGPSEGAPLSPLRRKGVFGGLDVGKWSKGKRSGILRNTKLAAPALKKVLRQRRRSSPAFPGSGADVSILHSVSLQRRGPEQPRKCHC